MNCPNCSHEIERGFLCMACGADTVLLKKAANNSIRFYNDALDKANASDLSGAIVSLNKSIAYNKNNIEARNLLGLVYYEVGQIGLALRHWVISGGLQKENNVAKEYIDHSQKNQRVFERLNDSLKMYNHALTYLQQNSDDMAVIQLKKAVEINSKFVEAHNLLALCYMMQKSNDKALSISYKVLEMDVNNEHAERYVKELNPSKSKVDTKHAAKQTAVQPPSALPRAYAPQSRQSARRRSAGGIGVYEIVSFVAGGIVVAALMYILFIPSQIDAREQKITSLENSLTKLKQNYEEQKAKDDETILKLETDNKSLQGQNTDLQSQTEVNGKVQKINTAANLYAQGNAEEAATALLGMDVANVPVEAANNYKSLIEKAFPKAAQSLYTKGKAKYDKKSFDEAKPLLENALQFAESVPVTKYNAMFYLGLICVSEENRTKATEYFEQVQASHPSASMKSRAKEQLRKLNQS